MRIFAGAMLAASLLVNGAMAEPLAPGRPAGVQQARVSSNTMMVMLGTGSLIMIAGGILISGTSAAVDSQILNSQNNIVAPPVSTVISTVTSTGTP